MDRNGYFQITNMQDGTYLKIISSEGNGHNAVYEDIVRYLSQFGQFQVNMFELKQKIKENNEDFLFKLDDKNRPPVDESISLSLSAEALKCRCKFFPPSNDGKLMDEDAINKELEKHGVKYGIDVEVIKEFVENRDYGKEYVIANGKAPIQGTDGRIEYFFNREQKLTPKEMDDGTVDFKNLDLISHVKKGDVLATLYKETLGESGFNVLGKEIQPKVVKKVKFSYGRNIELSEDGMSLISTVSGHVTVVDNKIFVSNVMEFNNIDMSTGNIEYDGNVIIKGDIRGGFSIISKGNIDAYGVVENAVLKAEGNIVLRYGIQGGGKGVLKAGGNIIAKFIENSTVEAGGDIQSEAIIHCNASAGGEVNLIGKKGIIVGGIIRATKKVNAKIIGTPMEVDTIIEVGADPTVIDRYHELSKELTKIKKDLSQIVPTITLYQNKRTEGEGLRPEILFRLQELTKIFREKKKLFDEYQEEYIRIQNDLIECDSGCVIASEIAHPGVRIMISDAGLTLRDEKKCCKFCKVDAEVKALTL